VLAIFADRMRGWTWSLMSDVYAMGDVLAHFRYRRGLTMWRTERAAGLRPTGQVGGSAANHSKSAYLQGEIHLKRGNPEGRI